MELRKKRSLTAVVLAVSILFTWPIWATGAARAVDVTELCTLTMTDGGNFEDNDMEGANVVIDLYKVAAAEADPAYDTYGYRVEDGFAALRDRLESHRDALDSDGWAELADQAAVEAMKGQTAAATAKLGEAVTELDCGLYLVIAHGKGLEPEDYVSENEDGKFVSLARSAKYEYSFFPYLVSLPSTADVLSGQEVLTSDGTWSYAVTGTLKPTREERFGPLEIVKNLTDFESGTPATFVFQVEATMDGETVYSNVVSISFSAAGTERVRLENVIPAGSHVEVTEVYSGAVYSVEGADVQTAEIDAETVATVTFSNRYNGSGNHGGAIINHFAYTPGGENGDEGAWEWTRQ